MHLTITLHGRYKTLAGSSQLKITIPDNATIWHVIDTFIHQYPEVAKDKSRMMVTKNHSYVSPDTPIHKTDSISIAPPLVSGG
ncbi:MAG: MoaD/ThiS family protein [Candidatus Thermoplasmatota archaeon]|nr:MoaD/ThiS family protein [Candidatus Thermoplasmatota archaeon]MBU1940724.1 MoaD/ThiS family protein [Candidatus Thermoplasmatota archaeon]